MVNILDNMPKGAKIPRCAYAIDWLQLSCDVPNGMPPAWYECVSPQNDAAGNHRFYSLHDSNYYIRGYNFQKEVHCNGYVVAHIACQPRTEHLPYTVGALKLENSVLYLADWYFTLTDILATLQWVPKKFSRLDLCADFNYFIGGLLPSTFLRSYIRKQDASFIRMGSNKFCVYGIKDMHSTSYDSIRWGSRQNGVSVYMYNKTRELMEVKNKPYIRAMWAKHNLSSTLDVWRVEISITSQGLGLKSASDAMLHTLFVDDFDKPEACRDIFKVYASKHFRFLRTCRSAKRKRDLEEVPLLDLATDCPLRPCTQLAVSDTGRMEQIIANRLRDMRSYLQSHELKDKYTMLDAVSKTIELFDKHFEIKTVTDRVGKNLEEDLFDAIRSAFNLPSAESAYYNLTRARKNLSFWQQVAREVSRSLIHNISHAYSKSPPPRTAVRNDFALPNYTDIPTPTITNIQQFVGSFFDDLEFECG